MAEVMDVAAAVQAAYGPVALSWRKLHKLLYFCQGWSLAWTGKPLFRERMEAWVEGPVVREVYRLQRHYPMTAPGSASALSTAERNVVDEVVRFYRTYTARQLIAITHREPPWRTARAGVAADASSRNEVRTDDLQKYFSDLSGIGGTFTDTSIPDTLRRSIDVLLSLPEDTSNPLQDSGVDFSAELAYLRGQGPNPWPSSSQDRSRS